jgi:hypothetical protein
MPPNPLLPQYDYDERLNKGLGGYRNVKTGRVVARAEIVRELENVSKASRENMRAVSQRLRDGQVTLAEWQATMAREVKTVHVYSAAAGKGGWAQMSQGDWGHTGFIVKEQYKFLQNFANEIASGKQPLNGRLIVRASLYGRGHPTEESIRKRTAISKGFTQRRRLRRASESCPGCIEVSSRGWVEIGSADDLPPIGSQQCRSNCLCIDEYR